eukprot:6247316-Pyramimonas_sp.AAC.1
MSPGFQPATSRSLNSSTWAHQRSASSRGRPMRLEPLCQCAKSGRAEHCYAQALKQVLRGPRESAREFLRRALARSAAL